MFDAALAEDAHHPESTIGRILAAWSKEEGLDAPLQEELSQDALAFVLDEGHGGVWEDTYLGPWWSAQAATGEVVTAPPRERVTEASIQHWRARAAALDHHVARARYSDAAWDLAQLAGVERRREDALHAIDSYVGQCEHEGSEVRQERCLRRAHSLARSLGDSQRLENVRTSLLTLCNLPSREATERLRFLACDLYLLDKKSDASDKEKSEILGWMEQGLAHAVDRRDPFDGERFAERLDVHYRRSGEAGAQKRVARSFGGLLEAWAAKGDGMLAMHNYKKAHEVYQRANLSDEARAVREKIQTSTARTQDELASLSATFEIPKAELDSLIEEIVGHEWPEALRRFVGHFFSRRRDYERQLQTWLDASVMYGLLSQTVLTASGDSVKIGSPSDDRESHMILKGAELLAMQSALMQHVLDALLIRHEVSPETLTALTDGSPLFLDDRRAMMKTAWQAYLLRDYATFLHLAIPQVEHALRFLFRHGAQSPTTTTRDNQRWRTLTLNQVLDSPPLAKALGDDLVLYLRIVLTHDLGLNMRNLVCHGLVGQRWFHRGPADRLVHVILLLAIAVTRRPSSESSGQEPSTPAA